MQKACTLKEILLKEIWILGKAALGQGRSVSLTIGEEKLSDNIYHKT